MATRNKIPRASGQDSKVYTRAGWGPADSPFADMTEKQKRTSIEEGRKLEKQFAKEKEEHKAGLDAFLAPIRHGVKSERDTQPVQVRMLKAQIKVLKQVAEQEDRSTSDVIRVLVDQYILHCLNTWQDGPRLDILRATLKAEEYEPLQIANAVKG